MSGVSANAASGVDSGARDGHLRVAMDDEHVTRAAGALLLSDAASPARLRVDLWNRVRAAVERIATGRPAEHGDVTDSLRRLQELERLWLFPGPERIERLRRLHRGGGVVELSRAVNETVDLLSTLGDRAAFVEEGEAGAGDVHGFTVLYVDTLPPERLQALRRRLRALRASRPGDLVYDLVQVGSLEEALLAVLCNTEIQAVVMSPDFPLRAARPFTSPAVAVEAVLAAHAAAAGPLCMALAALVRRLRPELDLYLLTDQSTGGDHVQTAAAFSRVFYRFEAGHELHMTLLEGVRDRMRAPFFDALRAYADRPIGNFHALPIARGHSVFNSRWIQDFGRFYGDNLFLAESSSTAGGLDSLLEPAGTIKDAQALAARCFGADRTFFVTNGTSTANKIVHMTLLRPGDIVLIDRNCHKSHHYGLVLAGAHPVYMDAYPLQPYALYGGVPLRALKQKLLDLRREGRLSRVRMVVLTNVTFDGITYDPQRVMEELLAIHPRLSFLWDEAWFAYARFTPLTRRRTGMAAAAALSERLRSTTYREEWQAFTRDMGPGGLDGLTDQQILGRRLLPDPDRTKVRVYVTQSTHKSLSAFRQASMIHVRDDLFESEAAEPFKEAYFAHSTTSPNHQLVASLDVARKQMELEGHAMVSEAFQLALRMRERVADDPLISRYLSVLEPHQLIPADLRASGFAAGFDRWAGSADRGAVQRAFADDEFVLDPTRLTVYTALTGRSGFEFRNAVLMERLGVQVNHTSINTVLMNATIGVTWGALSFLLDGLRREAAALDRRLARATEQERALFERDVRAITTDLPPLPDFSGFHAAFRLPDGDAGDLRAAYFQAFGDESTRHLSLTEVQDALDRDDPMVSTRFVVPYPPGFPVLVPGQIVSPAIVEFLRKLDVKEVHGYRADLGLAVFTAEALGRSPVEPHPPSEGDWQARAGLH